jgi:hypothetical protein
MNNSILQVYKFNIEFYELDIIKFVADKIILQEKMEIIKTLIVKKNSGVKLTEFEKKIFDVYKFNLVTFDDILNNNNKNIYGFIIGNIKGLYFYSLNDKTGKFEIDNGFINKIKKIKKKELEKYKLNNLHSLLSIKNDSNEPEFKIKDILNDDKKSITGSVCFPKSKNEIFGYINLLKSNYQYKNKQKSVICNDLELLFRLKDKNKDNNKRWFLNIEENILLN